MPLAFAAKFPAPVPELLFLKVFTWLLGYFAFPIGPAAAADRRTGGCQKAHVLARPEGAANTLVGAMHADRSGHASQTVHSLIIIQN
jgi:hypothetical protein